MQETRIVPCIVCNDGTEASMIARVHGGCHVCSNVIQPLCEQHWITCEPFGNGAEVIIEIGQEQFA